MKCEPPVVFPQKEILRKFIIGNPKRIILTKKADGSDIQMLSIAETTQNNPSKNEAKIKEAILNYLQAFKDNTDTLCGFVLYIGEAFSYDQPGEYHPDKLNLRLLKHENIDKEKLNLSKMETLINPSKSFIKYEIKIYTCLLYTSPSPRDS